jgi:hypothetical protein
MPDKILAKRIGLAAVPKPDMQIDLGKITEFLSVAYEAIFKLPENCLSSTHCCVMR